MNAKLLKKIEELTFYTIEKEKRIVGLKEKNRMLNAISRQLLKLQSKTEMLESKLDLITPNHIPKNEKINQNKTPDVKKNRSIRINAAIFSAFNSSATEPAGIESAGDETDTPAI